MGITWFNTVQVTNPTPDPPFVFPLDSWPGATAAYSVRKLSASYKGFAFKLRRAGDGAQADIGFLPHGNLDIAMALAFLGGDFGFIARWYDQSGNGNDLAQTDPNQQFFFLPNGYEVSPGILTSHPVLLANNAVISTGFISGTTFSSLASGAGSNYITTTGRILVGDIITGPSVAAGTRILAQLTGYPGGPGTYQVNISQTVGSVGALVNITTTGKQMIAPDSSVYKTTALHLFMVGKFGWGNVTATTWNGYSIIMSYPASGTALHGAHPWAICYNADTNNGLQNAYSFVSNGTENGAPGFAKVYTDYINAWDWSITATDQLVTVDDIAYDGTAQSGPQSGNASGVTPPAVWPGATLSYPSATGLYLNGGADQTCCSNAAFAEIILYSSKQTSRSNIVANQKTYHNMQAPPRTIVTPDGFTWLPQYVNLRFFSNASFPTFHFQTRNPIPVTGSNQLYYVLETNDFHWSMWQADPSKLATGQDLWRMEIRSFGSVWTGSSDGNRSELDPNYGDSPQPAGFYTPYGKTGQNSFAFYIEPGDPLPNNLSWFSFHQNHFTDGSFPPNNWSLDLYFGEFLQLSSDISSNSYNVPSWRNGNSFTRGVWYRAFLEHFTDSNRTTPQDTVSLWIEGPGIGGGTSFVNVFTAGPGNLNPTATGAANNGSYAKFGMYQGQSVEIPNTAIRYCNIETSADKSVLDLSARLTTPLALPTHT